MVETIFIFVRDLFQSAIILDIIYTIIKVGITYATKMQEIAEKKGYNRGCCEFSFATTSIFLPKIGLKKTLIFVYYF